MKELFETQSELQEELTDTQESQLTDDIGDLPADDAEIPAEQTSEGEESEEDTEESSENEIVSEENEQKTEKKTDAKKESKPKFKSNLPTGFSFNPLVMAIKPFYEKLIAEDEIFRNVVKERESREEKPKSLAECADYIMSEAYNYASKHKNGNFAMAGFPDEDMYRLIRHYYDEEFLEVHKVTNVKATISTTTTKPTTPAKGAEKATTKPSKGKKGDYSKIIPMPTKKGGKKTETKSADKVTHKKVNGKVYTITEFTLF